MQGCKKTYERMDWGKQRAISNLWGKHKNGTNISCWSLCQIDGRKVVGTDFKNTKIEQIGNKNECTDERRYKFCLLQIFIYRKVASSRLSWLVVQPLHFQTFYKRKIWCLYTVTFRPKRSKLNSRPVYCSKFYSKYLLLYCYANVWLIWITSSSWVKLVS